MGERTVTQSHAAALDEIIRGAAADAAGNSDNCGFVSNFSLAPARSSTQQRGRFTTTTAVKR
jgi:hypothetical protein